MTTMQEPQKFVAQLRSSNAFFIYSLTGIFLLLGLLGIFYHEMWRDELQAWLLAEDSASIGELMQNMKYEGHPALWHLCLFVISRFVEHPIAMQFFHLAIATLIIYIFLKFSPFTKLQKFLFTFSYYPLYEYGIISRNYSFGILFVFLFCVFYPKRTQSYLLLAILIALLANTNAYGFLLAAALAATLIADRILSRNNVGFTASRLNMLCSLGIVFAGFVISILQVMARIDSSQGPSLDPPKPSIDGAVPDLKLGGFNITRFILTFGLLLKSYAPIPNFFSYTYWNTSIFTSIDNLYTKAFALLLAFGLLFLAIILLSRKPVPLFLYLFGTLSIIFFCYEKQIGQVRHYGHLFILLVACFWLTRYYPEVRFNFLVRVFEPLVVRLSQHRNQFISILLAIHVVVGAFAFGMDLLYPFSGSQETADFIKKQNLDNVLIVGSSDAPASSVAALLNQEFYYPESDRFGTFILWQNRKKVRAQVMLKKVSQLLTLEQNKALLVLSYELDQENPDLKISKLFNSRKSITSQETYSLYLVERN